MFTQESSTQTRITPERMLQRATVTLMRHPLFAELAPALTIGTVRVDDKTPTARTNGRDEWWGGAFVMSLTEAELAFVKAHECMHKILRHLITWKKLHDENHQLANMACDYVINLMLRDLDPRGEVILMPRYKDGPNKGKPMGLLDDKYRGMHAKQVFDLLKQQQGEGQGGGSGQGEPSDTGNGGGSGDGFDDHDWDGAGNLSDDEQADLDRDLADAVAQGVANAKKLRGEGAGGLVRTLSDLLKPQVDWRKELREYIKTIASGKDASTWRRPNRRFLHQDIYMPTLISERIDRVLVGIDTSGSISNEDLAAFLSEVQGIAVEVKPKKVDLLYWDHVVAAHEEYNEGAVELMTRSTRPKGGGGTSPSCVSTYIKDKRITPEVIIMLTDGVVGSDWGRDWPVPVLWCIKGNNRVNAGCGKTLHIDN
jgi:predicted metal-dependent peptidase